MVLDAGLLNTHHKVRIKGKVEQSREWSSALPYTSVSPLTTVINFAYIYIYTVIRRQTVSLYHNLSVWLNMRDTSSWDRNPANFTPAW